MRLFKTIGIALVMGALLGCGGDDDGSGASTPAGSGGGSSSSSSSYTCCINSTYYVCPDQAAMEKCGDFVSPDPSGCQKQSVPCPGSGDSGDSGDSSGSGGADVGKTCTGNADCATNLCLFHGEADYGYCTTECESFSDCPSFWDCTNVGNASGTYCVKD